jgi:hypothetical protein
MKYEEKIEYLVDKAVKWVDCFEVYMAEEHFDVGVKCETIDDGEIERITFFCVDQNGKEREFPFEIHKTPKLNVQTERNKMLKEFKKMSSGIHNINYAKRTINYYISKQCCAAKPKSTKINIEYIGIPTEAVNILKSVGVITVDDLIHIANSGLLRDITGIGPSYLMEIVYALDRHLESDTYKDGIYKDDFWKPV